MKIKNVFKNFKNTDVKETFKKGFENIKSKLTKLKIQTTFLGYYIVTLSLIHI